MTHNQLLTLLADAGFDTGWALHGEQLVLWEHDEDPPLPLIRPDQPIVEEIPVMDESVVDESVVE